MGSGHEKRGGSGQSEGVASQRVEGDGDLWL